MNRKKIYTIVFTSIFCVCLFGYIWSWFVTRGIDNEARQSAKQEREVKIKDLILTESKMGRVHWELYAKEGKYEGSDKNVILKDIIGNFYNEQGEIELSFEAGQGTYMEESKSVLIEDDVLAVIKDGTRIKADKILWAGQDSDIQASGDVIINHNNELITKSDKATFDTKLTYIKIEGKSESRIYKTPEKK